MIVDDGMKCVIGVMMECVIRNGNDQDISIRSAGRDLLLLNIFNIHSNGFSDNFVQIVFVHFVNLSHFVFYHSFFFLLFEKHPLFHFH